MASERKLESLKHSVMKQLLVRLAGYRGLHPGEDRAQLVELRVPVQRFQARIGERLEEPRAAGLRGGAQFREGCVVVSQRYMGSRRK